MSNKRFVFTTIAVLLAAVLFECTASSAENPPHIWTPMLSVIASSTETPEEITPALVTASPVPSPVVQINLLGIIAFTSVSRIHMPIALIDLENKSIEDISENGADSLSWSPDGQQIAFNGGISPLQQIDIYVMKRDGSELTRLTNNAQGKYDIDWSPDSRFLVYTYNNHVEPSDLAVINLDDKNMSLLTESRGYESHPAWSPNSSQIAYLYSENGDSPKELWLIDLDTKISKQIINFPVVFGRIAWSPDGEWIAFISKENSEDCGDVYVVMPDGSGLTRLTDLPGCATDVVWSPDGEYLAFIGRDNAVGNIMNWGWQIYVMDAKGHNIVPVTSEKEWVINDIDWVSNPAAK